MQTNDEILLSVNQFAGADKIRPPAAFRVGIRGQGVAEPDHLPVTGIFRRRCVVDYLQIVNAPARLEPEGSLMPIDVPDHYL